MINADRLGITDVAYSEVVRICDQLAEKSLIHWRRAGGRLAHGAGKITAFGVDVIDGNIESPIAIRLDLSQSYSVTDSTGVQIGQGNVQTTILIDIEKIMAAIDGSTVSEAEKAQAKSLLKHFLSHPLVASILGGLASDMNF